jgi:hypothetical protein
VNLEPAPQRDAGLDVRGGDEAGSGRQHEAVLTEGFGIEEEIAERLWPARQMLHGVHAFESKVRTNWPSCLRAVVVMAVKSQLSDARKAVDGGGTDPPRPTDTSSRAKARSLQDGGWGHGVLGHPAVTETVQALGLDTKPTGHLTGHGLVVEGSAEEAPPPGRTSGSRDVCIPIDTHIETSPQRPATSLRTSSIVCRAS